MYSYFPSLFNRFEETFLYHLLSRLEPQLLLNVQVLTILIVDEPLLGQSETPAPDLEELLNDKETQTCAYEEAKLVCPV